MSSSNTWHPTDAAARFTFSNGNLTATSDSTSTSGNAIRGKASVASGKYYAEVYIDHNGGSADYFNNAQIGVGTVAGFDKDEECGGAAAWGWVERPEFAVNRHNATNSSDNGLGAASDGDVIQVAFDADTGKVWFGRNNTWQGDPGAGTGEAYTVTGSAWYLVATGGLYEEFTARFDSGDWSYSAPSGFGEWPDPPVEGDGIVDIAIEATGTGWVEKEGDGDVDLAIEILGTGFIEKEADGAVDIALEVTGQGVLNPYEGYVDIALEILGTASSIYTMTAALELPAFSATGTAETGSIGSTAITLPALQLSAAGSEEADLTLHKLQLVASGLAGSIGTASPRIPRLAVTASGGADTLGSASIVLPAAALAGVGFAGPVGTAAITTPRLALLGVGNVGSDGSAALVLRPLTGVGEGVMGSLGSSALELEPLYALGEFAWPSLSRELHSLNTEVLAGSRYANLAFDHVVELGGRIYLAGAAGLFRLEGADDDGADIDAFFKTGLDDFGNDYHKGATNVWLGFTSDGDLQVTVGVDGGASYAYDVTNDRNSSGYRSARAPVGRGLRSLYWQLGVANVAGADFTVDVLSINMAPTKRKS